MQQAVEARLSGVAVSIEFKNGLLDAEFYKDRGRILLRAPESTQKEHDVFPMQDGILLCVTIQEALVTVDVIVDLVNQALALHKKMSKGALGKVVL